MVEEKKKINNHQNNDLSNKQEYNSNSNSNKNVSSSSFNEKNKNKRFKHIRKPFKKLSKPKKYEEKVISVSRITKVTKGGRQFRFSAIVVIGDRKGLVGLGTGKANEVPNAIKKAIKSAEKSLVRIPLEKTTIPYEVLGKHSGGKVLIKPAKLGKGIIAGGPCRVVLELSGIKDIYSKSLGSNTKINMIRATLNGLSQLKTRKQYLAQNNIDQEPKPKTFAKVEFNNSKQKLNKEN